MGPQPAERGFWSAALHSVLPWGGSPSGRSMPAALEMVPCGDQVLDHVTRLEESENGILGWSCGVIARASIGIPSTDLDLHEPDTTAVN